MLTPLIFFMNRHVAWSDIGELHLEYSVICRRLLQPTPGKSAQESVHTAPRCYICRYCKVFCPCRWFLPATEWDHSRWLGKLHDHLLLCGRCISNIKNWIWAILTTQSNLCPLHGHWHLRVNQQSEHQQRRHKLYNSFEIMITAHFSFRTR